MGHISPLDGIGPDELAVELLLWNINEYPVKEVILATNLTVEGEATADYLSGLLESRDVVISRLARGVPVGGRTGIYGFQYSESGLLRKAHAAPGVIIGPRNSDVPRFVGLIGIAIGWALSPRKSFGPAMQAEFDGHAEAECFWVRGCSRKGVDGAYCR